MIVEIILRGSSMVQTQHQYHNLLAGFKGVFRGGMLLGYALFPFWSESYVNLQQKRAFNIFFFNFRRSAWGTEIDLITIKIWKILRHRRFPMTEE